MTRDIASIHKLFTAVEQSIPNVDGHRIRVAERRILWSKLAGFNKEAMITFEQAWAKNPGDAVEIDPATNQPKPREADISEQDAQNAIISIVPTAVTQLEKVVPEGTMISILAAVQNGVVVGATITPPKAAGIVGKLLSTVKFPYRKRMNRVESSFEVAFE